MLPHRCCLADILKHDREVRDLQDSIAKGSFVPESQLYQQAQRDIHAAREDVERQRLLINTLQQERAGLQSKQQHQELQVMFAVSLYTYIATNTCST